MRIWIICQNAYAPSHSASTRHFEIARQLVRRGHEVLIVASSFYHKERRETRLAEGEAFQHETIDGVRYLWLRTPPYQGNGVKRLWNMSAFTWKAWRRVGLVDEPAPDVVIGSSPHLFSPWAALRIARKFDVPFLLEIRDVWPAVPIEMGGMSRWHPLMLLFARLEKLYYRRAERVISVLPDADRHVDQTIGRSDHVVWIPNGSPLDAVKPPQRRDGPLTFMYAGAHSSYAGLDVVLDAAEMLQRDGWSDRVRIRLVGDGPEKPRLQAAASRRGLSAVVFEPPVPKSDVFAKLQEADAFLMIYADAPVMRFGLCPNKLYDYLGAARPVAFAMSTPNNPVCDAQAGVSVKPQDAAALAEGIKQLAGTSHSERVAMGRRGRAYVEQHHSFERLGERFSQVLADVASSKPTAPRVRLHTAPPEQFQPIVVIGAPRSGTNMLRDVLASLPAAGTWPCDELNLLWRYGNRSHPHDQLLPKHVTKANERVVRRAFARLAERRRLHFVIEKTCANSLRVGFVDKVLPDAKYVFLLRDGRDAAASAMGRWKAPVDLRYVARKVRYVPARDVPYYASRFAVNRLKRFGNSEKRLATWGPRFAGIDDLLRRNSLAEVCAWQWRECVEQARDQLWKLPYNRVYQLRYEDFVKSPAEALRRLLTFHQITATEEQIAVAVQNVTPTSIGKSQSTLSAAARRQILSIASPVLKEFGYPVEPETVAA